MEDLIKDITITEIKPNDLIIVRVNRKLEGKEMEEIKDALGSALSNKIIFVYKNVEIKIERE